MANGLPMTQGFPTSLLLSVLGRSRSAPAIEGLGDVANQLMALNRRRRLLQDLSPDESRFMELGASPSAIYQEHALNLRNEAILKSKMELAQQEIARRSQLEQERAQERKDLETLKSGLRTNTEKQKDDLRQKLESLKSGRGVGDRLFKEGAQIARNIINSKYKTKESFSADDKKLLEPFGYKFEYAGKSFPMFGNDEYNLSDLPTGEQESAIVGPRVRRLKVQLPNGKIKVVNETDKAIPGAKYIGEGP